MSTAAEIGDWLRLTQCPGVGAETARKLLANFGLPENVFSAQFSALIKIVPERVAYALLAPPSGKTRTLIEITSAWAEQSGNHVMTLADAVYPKTLLDIPDPPLMLYAKGRLDLLASPSIAIVGSRNATTQGALNAEKFAEVLSESGLTIVSGLALGIDTAAHQGGLRGKGATVAVIGTGPDIVYPARNRELAHQIAADGCILSEYPLGVPAIAANFPRRNRIISGLSRAVLVIEAAAQSGSLITARMAAEQGRDVLAIPGSIHSPLAKGCHQLIKQGAKLVESAQDVLEEVGVFPSKNIVVREETSTVSSREEDATCQLLQIMGFDPVSLDRLAIETKLTAAALSVQLLDLEMAGRIEMSGNGLYQRLS